MIINYVDVVEAQSLCSLDTEADLKFFSSDDLGIWSLALTAQIFVALNFNCNGLVRLLLPPN